MPCALSLSVHVRQPSVARRSSERAARRRPLPNPVHKRPSREGEEEGHAEESGLFKSGVPQRSWRIQAEILELKFAKYLYINLI